MATAGTAAAAAAGRAAAAVAAARQGDFGFDHKPHMGHADGHRADLLGQFLIDAERQADVYKRQRLTDSTSGKCGSSSRSLARSCVLYTSWMLGGFFVLGVSSWHLLRKNELDLFKRSVRIAAPFTLILVLLLGLQGHHHAQIVAEMQPAKLAAMESHWETGTHVPMYLLTWPDQANRTNSIQALPIPSLLSLLAFNSPSAEVKGRCV